MGYLVPIWYPSAAALPARKRLTLLSSLRSLRLRLYDEESRRLIGFRET
jgi:hypothetical protein